MPGFRHPPPSLCLREQCPPGTAPAVERARHAHYAHIVTERAPLSRKLSAIAESATLKVDAKAKSLQAAGRPVISYAAGEPDFATPQFVVDAAAEALRDPANFRYTPAVGLPVLRDAIAAKTLRDSGLA